MGYQIRWGALAALIALAIGASILLHGKPTAASAATLGAPTPGSGAMTIYSVSNANSSTLNVLFSFSNASGFAYQMWDQVAPGATNTYHVRDIAAIPHPFNGSVAIHADHPFTAQIVGYDYPATSSTVTAIATPSVSPTTTPTVSVAQSPPAGGNADLALGRPAQASSTATGSSPSYAVDGNDATAWTSAAGGQQWLSVDLGASRSINQVDLLWGAAYATSYYVEFSSDNVNWVPVWTVTNGTSSKSIGVTGTARYVRILATAGVNVSQYQLATLQVIGPATPTFTPSATPSPTSTPTFPSTPTATWTSTTTPDTPTPTPTLAATGSACPCTIWGDSTAPAVADANDSGSVELGVKFRADTSGTISGIRFYKGSTNTGIHVGSLWTSAGTLLAQATFSGETSSGWQQVSFATPVPIKANTTYVASYHTTVGAYAIDTGYFTASGVDNSPLHALQSGGDGPNAVYAYGANSAFPTNSYNDSNYWVDVVFAPSSATSTPTSTMAAGTATSTATSTPNPTATPPMTSTSTPTLTPSTTATPTSLATTAPTGTPTPTITPTLASTSTPTPTRTATVAATSTPTTTSPTCPCTLWSASTTPMIPANPDANGVELGVKFQSSIAGYVIGVRFYRGSGNVGPHVGSLWTSDGTLLAQATFTNETASGWQQVNFSAPVAIAANTTYVASYYTPSGYYAKDPGYFNAAWNNPPLQALASGTSGGNGVALYGSGGFPNLTFDNSNYWVDVVFTTSP